MSPSSFASTAASPPQTLHTYNSSPRTSAPASPSLNKSKHIQYFLRCLKTHLPTQYQSAESQRLSFAYFILSALDLLDVLHSKTSSSERREWADWIYRLQHEGGGWKGFTGADVGEFQETERESDGSVGENVWDPANLGATFFALGALMVLGDGMERVRHVQCLRWLKSLQRQEGNFGEALGKAGAIEGGGDVRFCYLAAGVRWMLRRGKEAEKVPDVDVDALIGYIGRSVVSTDALSDDGMVDRLFMDCETD